MAALPVRLSVLLAALSVLVLLSASRPQALLAQCQPWEIECGGGGGPGDQNPPGVTILPTATSYSGSGSTYNLAVTIEWCDDNALNSTTRSIVFRGQTVTGSFNYATGTKAGCVAFATSTGVVTLQPGSNALSASIKDAHANTGSNSKTYTYTQQIPPSYTVVVTPDEQASAPAAYSSASQTFRVQNLGNTAAVYNLEVICAPPAATSCSSPGPVSLGPNTFQDVPVTFETGPQGAQGAIRVRASYTADVGVRDDGSVNLTVGNGGPTTARVSVIDANPGTTFQRDGCLTIAIVADVAYECGDVRAVHALPAVRTMNKGRVPTLLYNSRTAQVAPIVAANVILAAGASEPTRVTAALWVRRPAGDWWNPANGEWQGSGFVAGRPARIALSYEAAGEGTRFVEYRLDVTAWYGTSPQALGSPTGQFILVDRSQSPFGAGWWLAGLEQLLFVPGSSDIAWVGGDGSTRLYRPTGQPNRWAAAAVVRPDTLVQEGSTYKRLLPHRIVVKFNSTGRHAATINRLGHTTDFTYDGSGRLWTIQPPIPGPNIAGASGIRPIYTFTYEPGQIRITAPPSPQRDLTELGREVLLSLVNGTVRSIRDPDTHQVQFTYDEGLGFPRRIASRADRRATPMRFTYSHAHVIESSSTGLPGVLAATDSFPRVAEVQGLATTGTSQAAPLDSVYTLVNGPRPGVVLDHNRFWVDRFGAPSKTRDAAANGVILTRGDARYPGLVTETRSPNGLKTWATYDARGNIASSTAVRPYGDNRDATTLFIWDQSFDFVKRVVAPEGDVTAMSYDPSTGNREWQEDGRGASARVTFQYYIDASRPGSHEDSKLLRSVTSPGPLVDRVEYDLYGNVSRTISPRLVEKQIVNDRVGRTRLVRTQIDATGKWQHDSTDYDLADRVTRAVSYGDALNNVVAQRVIAESFYNPDGSVDSVRRSMDPNTGNLGPLVTHWRYDPLGRTIAEIAPDKTPATLADNPVDSTFYDEAGNSVRVLTRRRDTISSTYDALNRITKRRLSQVDYRARYLGIPKQKPNLNNNGLNPPYPRYANNTLYDPTVPPDFPEQYGGLTIFADSSLFEYDALGSVRVADNSDAWVHRAYYPNGQIKLDSLYVRTVAGNEFTRHKYGLEYKYDRNGRTTLLRHPGQLSPGVSIEMRVLDTTSYSYDPLTGALRTVTDVLGNVFTYAYNARNEVESLSMPRSMQDTYSYDADGNLEHHLLRDATTTYRDMRLWYDLRGKVTRSENGKGAMDTLATVYGGLGHLIRSEHFAHARLLTSDVRYTTLETFSLDPLGNRKGGVTWRTEKIGNGPPTNDIWDRGAAHEPGTGRLLVEDYLAIRDTTIYDAAGNIVFAYRWKFGQWDALQDRASFYAADGTLRAADFRTFGSAGAIEAPFKTVFEEYRYDALGRRVWVRSRRYCEAVLSAAEKAECNVSTVRRTVWDGARELYEIQMPGGDLVPVDTLENDTEFVKRSLVDGGNFDPNPVFGRVAYAYGLTLDAPLSITRINYADQANQGTYQMWPSFTIVPLWNVRQQADNGFFALSGGTHCLPQAPTRCVKIDYPAAWVAYGRLPRYKDFWHGTLLDDKLDQSGQMYRRNRYYDPRSGRFTQEDPIGLAGGLNLYGFANGDPVTYSDPFGLCPKDKGGDGRTPHISDCPEGTEGHHQFHNPQIVDASWELFAAVTGVYGVVRASVSGIVAGARAWAARRAAAAAAEAGFSAAESAALRTFLGRGAEGAAARLADMAITPGITRELLLRYKVVALRALAGEGGKKVTERVIATQTARLQVIEAALKLLP